MGSEKKRKRKEAEATDDTSQDVLAAKAEKKRLKKLKKEAKVSAEQENDTSDQVVPLKSEIAEPMANRKLTKKLYKLISGAAKEKALRRGIKEVALSIRKGDSGIVVFAGDVFPVEVIAHLPLVCEEANVPYCFVPRKIDLGMAGLTKRPTSVVLISEKKCNNELKDELTSLKKDVASIQNLY